MKKIILNLVSVLIIGILSGCSNTETIKETITQTNEIIIDFSSSTSFEKTINEEKDVNGKIVKVLINEVIENNDSLTKFKTGKSLIFIGDEDINIDKDDYIVARIIQEPVKKDENWQVRFECIKLIESKNDFDENDTTTNGETIVEDKKIKMDKDSSNYVGLDKVQIEKEFEEKGFQNIEFKEVKTTNSDNKDNTITSIIINDKAFKKNDEFNKEDKVIITYWKYEKPVSEYEKAFMRDMSSYDLYYMFDTDTKKVIFFGTNDTYIERGTYSGDFNSGVTINWSHGEWKEKFVNKNDKNSATLTDGNGLEWKYEKCDVSEAQKVLDSLK